MTPSRSGKKPASSSSADADGVDAGAVSRWFQTPGVDFAGPSAVGRRPSTGPGSTGRRTPRPTAGLQAPDARMRADQWAGSDRARPREARATMSEADTLCPSRNTTSAPEGSVSSATIRSLPDRTVGGRRSHSSPASEGDRGGQARSVAGERCAVVLPSRTAGGFSNAAARHGSVSQRPGVSPDMSSLAGGIADRYAGGARVPETRRIDRPGVVRSSASAAAGRARPSCWPSALHGGATPADTAGFPRLTQRQHVLDGRGRRPRAVWASVYEVMSSSGEAGDAAQRGR